MSLSRQMLLVAIFAFSAGCQSTTAPLAATDAAIEGEVIAASETPADSAVALAMHTSATAATAPVEEPATLASHTAPAPTADDAVLRELKTIMAVDPAAAGHLVDQLQTVKPSLRPLVAEQFRSSWEYHRELTGQDATRLAARPIDPEIPSVTAGSSSSDGAAPVHSAGHGESKARASSPSSAIAYDPEKFNAGPPDITPVANHDESPLHMASTSGDSTQPQSWPHRDASNEPLANDDLAPVGWHELVDQAVVKLAATTPDDPRTTDEAYAHARLRLLQLVAGHTDDAVAPIPGLTPTEQGY